MLQYRAMTTLTQGEICVACCVRAVNLRVNTGHQLRLFRCTLVVEKSWDDCIVAVFTCDVYAFALPFLLPRAFLLDPDASATLTSWFSSSGWGPRFWFVLPLGASAARGSGEEDWLSGGASRSSSGFVDAGGVAVVFCCVAGTRFAVV